MLKALVLLNFFFSAFLTGLIWFVQIVHYPLFRRVSEADFGAFHRIHTHTTGLVVGFPMVAELGLVVTLLMQPMSRSAQWISYGAAACVAVIWGVTFLVSVPIHSTLERVGYDVVQIDRLVLTNWLRTLAWTVRTALVGYLLWKV